MKPGTPVEPYLDLLAEFDQVLVMTVEPGFGGQTFMPETMPKLALLADAVAERAASTSGCRSTAASPSDTIGIAAEAGADTFVAGSRRLQRRRAGRRAIAQLRDAASAARRTRIGYR